MWTQNFHCIIQITQNKECRQQSPDEQKTINEDIGLPTASSECPVLVYTPHHSRYQAWLYRKCRHCPKDKPTLLRCVLLDRSGKALASEEVYGHLPICV